MIETILVLNAGSSSVKFSLFSIEKELLLLAHGQVADIGNKPVFTAVHHEQKDVTRVSLQEGATQENACHQILDWIHAYEQGWRVCIVAHRIVHGGADFTGPVRVTSDIFHKLKTLCPLAPLHQPHNLAAFGITDHLLPHVPQIACFDTAFHVNHEPIFEAYAVSRELKDKGIRRYGFHGLSYSWIAHVLKQDYPDLARGHVIAAHLGNGSSLCAMVNGQSIDTSMGMTALDGVPMGTRSGSFDPAAVIYMIRDLGMTPDEVEHSLYEESGLKGLSEMTNDVKILLASQDPRARFALDYFALRIAQYCALLAVSIQSVDAIVFTGGIGENATPLREAVMRRLTILGQPRVLVIPANEERMMAMQARDYIEHAEKA